MAGDALTEFAKLLKERDNQQLPSATTGIVLSLPSNPKIRLNEFIVLDKDQLVFAQSIVSTLSVGNEVILVPVADGQLYYVIDKAVRY